MKGVITKKTEDFDPIMLTYTEHSVCYPDDKHFLYLVTPMCKVLHILDNHIWLAIGSGASDFECVREVIDAVDVNLVQHRCRSTQEYMEQIANTTASLKLSPSLARNVLVVKINNSTEIYGTINRGDSVRVALYANYHRYGIVWSAAKIKSSSSSRHQSEEAPDFLQECQLEQTFIKI